MEYNFLADFLAKFSYLTPWIQGIIILSAATVPISFFYFLKEIIAQLVESFTIRNICKKDIEEKTKAASTIVDGFLDRFSPTQVK